MPKNKGYGAGKNKTPKKKRKIISFKKGKK